MSGAKHTLGLWVAGIDGRHHAVILEDERIAAYCGIVGALDDEESAANARLIAAAPELLEALRELIGWIPNASTLERMGFHTDAPVKAHAKARAAIAKATGVAA